MSYCDHCSGQRFDRAQVLRTLRALRRSVKAGRLGKQVDDALTTALKTIAQLDIPHLEVEPEGSEVVH